MNHHIFQDNDPIDCLEHIGKQICDSYVEEECEYSGELLESYINGEITSVKPCQDMCQLKAPDCKYWIYNDREKECILREDGRKTCTGWGGPKEPSYDHCKNLSMSSHALFFYQEN